MEGAPRPGRGYEIWDKCSSGIMIMLLGIALLLVIADTILIGWVVLQASGMSFDWQILPVSDAPKPTATWTTTEEPTATRVLEPTATATPTLEPTITPTKVVEPTFTPTRVAEPTATFTPTRVVEPTATAARVVRPTATPTAAIVEWRGEYFDNVSLIGAAKVVRNDQAVHFDWGSNAPATGLPADGFSARWSRMVTFEAGLYRFRAVADDGIRLYVDGDLLIDEWRDGAQRASTAERWLAAGKHTLRVEYYERSGVAMVQLSWEKTTSYPDWKGEYWANRDLRGSPVLVRNDRDLAFDWKQGSPGEAVPVDDFSARWTRKADFQAGTYRFHVLLDDGVRLWLNDRLILDEWFDHDSRQLTTDYALVKGTYTVKVEYYERIGNARVHVWWEKIPSPSYPDWKGEYWPNRSLTGDVVLVRNDHDIDFSWGPNAPFPGMPVDNFAVRWTRTINLDAATFRFHAIADDGVRIWVDGQLLINAWHDQMPTDLTVERAMVRGAHSIKVEYYEHTGGARVRVWWEKVVASYPDWKGEYWPNRKLTGDPALVRNDRAVDFDWDLGSAAPGLPDDSFSARWTRQVTFQPGTYQFLAWADDGIRVYVDGQLVLDEWHDSTGDEVYRAGLPLSGAHQIEVRYYEAGGHARLRFWWRRTGNLPNPPGSAPKSQVLD